MFAENKNVKVMVQKDYTTDEFYELIKDHPFTAGKPEKIRYMMTDRIVFPAIDKRNQVQIMKTGQKKWYVTKQEEAKVESIFANTFFYRIFGWIGIFINAFGENSKKTVALVETTAKELEALNL